MYHRQEVKEELFLSLKLEMYSITTHIIVVYTSFACDL